MAPQSFMTPFASLGGSSRRVRSRPSSATSSTFSTKHSVDNLQTGNVQLAPLEHRINLDVRIVPSTPLSKNPSLRLTNFRCNNRIKHMYKLFPKYSNVLDYTALGAR